MARYYYYVDVSNAYLGKYRRVTGRTKREAEFKASLLRQQWADQETRARRRQLIADLRAEAAALTEEAQEAIDEHRSVLRATLDVDDRIDWDALLIQRPVTEPEPSLEEICRRLHVPNRSPVLEFLRIRSVRARLDAEAEARALYEDEVEGWKKLIERREREIEAQRAELSSFRSRYEGGDRQAVIDYVSLVLSRSSYPESFGDTARIVDYVQNEKLAVVNVEVPPLAAIPTVQQYRFDSEREDIVAVPLSQAQQVDLFDSVVYQTVLRTMHEVFEADYVPAIESVVVNVITTAVDGATGRDTTRCIATCSAQRDSIEQLDLARVDPKECFRALNGLTAGRPSGLRDVQPLRRPIDDTAEAVGIAVHDKVSDDLLAMDPFAFEQLVGTLFRRVFSDPRVAIEVTQASHDGGVDVLVTDPDPVRGGKTVIQVKRYAGAVGVGYVRELYGTMMNERAARGILVATGRFGADAHAFADGKPITLIDGDELLKMLGAHGWVYRLGEFAPA